MALGKNMKLNKDKLIGKAGKEKTPAKASMPAAEGKKAAQLQETAKAPEIVAEIIAPVKDAPETGSKSNRSKPDATRLEDNRRSTTESRNKAGKDSKDKDSEVDITSEGYLNEQLNRVLYALDAFKKGDISVRLTKQNNDIFAEIAEAYNSMVEMIGGVGGEVSRISKVAGVEGNLKARASAENASGFWKDMINNINGLVDSIAVPVLEVGKVLEEYLPR